jgi:hypothetical protein
LLTTDRDEHGADGTLDFAEEMPDEETPALEVGVRLSKTTSIAV